MVKYPEWHGSESFTFKRKVIWMASDFKSSRFIQRTVSVFGEDDLPGIERFISGFDAYLKSVIVEAEDRVTGNHRTVNDYIIVRRDTCAAKPTFSCLGLGLDIPNEVFNNPFILSLLENATDLILISNVSYLIIFDRSEPNSH